MRRVIVCALMLAFVSSVFAQDQERRDRRRMRRRGRRATQAIVPRDAKLEGPLYTRSAPIKGGLTEGPAVAPDGSIYFSDIANGPDKGMIVRYDPKTNKSEIFTTDSGKSNGLFFDAKGFLIACEGSDEGGRRVSKWNVKTKERTTLADRFEGKRFNAPNDLTIDRQGRIYFTDPRYLGTEPRELKYRAVYRIGVDGKVVEVTHDISKPNGIALSPDEKTLYVLDHDNGTDQINPKGPQPKHGRMALDAFPLGDDGLVHGEKRTVIDFGDQAGGDGMTVDDKGNLYIADRSTKRPGVRITDPNGKEIGFITTGEPNQTVDADHPAKGFPSNVEFGNGADKNLLYVTVDLSLYRIRLNAHGYHPQDEKQ
ncbi:MAG TPA: SMP-30/gluconolactonase/LRE family protein [Planctomycetaceae bacterium]|jgi:gluconolactonase|nr:SMP-30/gluconolactonase/LRE family protein [Planctomycetaceae bacterium]